MIATISGGIAQGCALATGRAHLFCPRARLAAPPESPESVPASVPNPTSSLRPAVSHSWLEGETGISLPAVAAALALQCTVAWLEGCRGEGGWALCSPAAPAPHCTTAWLGGLWRHRAQTPSPIAQLQGLEGERSGVLLPAAALALKHAATWLWRKGSGGFLPQPLAGPRERGHSSNLLEGMLEHPQWSLLADSNPSVSPLPINSECLFGSLVL